MRGTQWIIGVDRRGGFRARFQARVRIKLLRLLEPRTYLIIHPLGNSAFHHGTRDRIEGTASDEDKRPGRLWMSGSIGKGKHGAPRSAQQSRSASFGIRR